ncbi:MAG TPA: ATP-binding protein [Bacteroidales bacterium]|nr:MAG: histidine kinase [Bacteroidetes bacterium GWF2_33_38]OFY75466.1 MAG: histidine kinase [Bacteroidetes bacterium RIFOXYA12_FULL_33_9]OFY90083.1 MAG: histidine kinase [Bacteroidetes bacterium RIFOXYA2_FULL_33_7]HBF88985.1 ATP-binding protein [Bacteroidales bacterium]
MIYKKLEFNLVLRIVGIAISLFLLFYSIQVLNYIVVPFFLAAFIVFQIYLLIQLIRKTNKYLIRFLQAIRYSDFSSSFEIDGLGTAYDDLKNTFNEVISDFQKIRAEKEQQFIYLQNVVNHIGIGLIAFQPDGTVEMLNNATKSMFGISSLSHIDKLNNVNPDLVGVLKRLPAGDRTLVKFQEKDDLFQLAIFATEFTIGEKCIKLVSIQNIQYELEENELEAWQKLIRVLTHEIMNSIAPIASLSSTVNSIIDETAKNHKSFSDESISDIQYALSTIHKRSNGLIDFVESYRSLTRIPKSNFKIVKIVDLFKNVQLLMGDECKNKNIKIGVSLESENISLIADEQQIEQILINLIKNSIYAIGDKQNGEIKLNAFINSLGRICIQVTDNGCGILPDVLDKIFVPFFTTKQKGSGIGLSLSRQIMRLHGGTITVQSEPEIETIFNLKF